MAVSKIRKSFRLFLLTFWCCAFGWLFYSMQEHGVAASAFESDAAVQVQDASESLRFIPVADTNAVGLIFYPGALVDPDAYAPMARAVAEAGYEVVIIKIPFRAGMIERNRDVAFARTQALLAADAGRKAWVVGGHSRGGKMATQLALARPDLMQGLLLVGTSHPREDDLSHLTMDVTKVFASEDGLASEAEVHQFAANLPAHTHWIRIDGGNHAQFGWYGRQLGDSQATISREAQQQHTVEAIVDQLTRVAQASAAPPSSSDQSGR